MSMLTFEYCCCCFDLRIGSLIIGYLNVIFNLVITVLCSLKIRDGLAIKRLGLDSVFDISTPIIATNSIELAIALLFIIFSLMLIYGIHKYQRLFVKSYLIYSFVFIILVAVIFFVCLGTETMGPGQIITFIIAVAINIYFLLVVRSYYLTMGEIQTNYNG
ncbi:lysosomal-associated transmembrane protein 4A-like [Colias croceus]|uniref:lysosomal-associated transmembrane protein 4A-like n=1 Tax=Colias crocea TaxID=72248 RepID=UPI001E27DE18|nr:lysosomal-associated transmembrane protein 4A-like [Colias croceus]XP_045499828.1 lysosomal-associated transmembrane protein 4A-like [Colias croceus]